MKKFIIFLFIAAISTLSLAQGNNPHVIISTSMGDMQVELFSDKAPETVKNFLRYVDRGFYNGTIFHRVIGNFMIQGGGMIPGMAQKQTMAPVINEAIEHGSQSTGHPRHGTDHGPPQRHGAVFHQCCGQPFSQPSEQEPPGLRILRFRKGCCGNGNCGQNTERSHKKLGPPSGCSGSGHGNTLYKKKVNRHADSP